jgi:hypothetical protein
VDNMKTETHIVLDEIKRAFAPYAWRVERSERQVLVYLRLVPIPIPGLLERVAILGLESPRLMTMLTVGREGRYPVLVALTPGERVTR